MVRRSRDSNRQPFGLLQAEPQPLHSIIVLLFMHIIGLKIITRSFWFCQRAYLQEVCEYLSIPGSTPKRFVQHRWLSSYDVGVSTQTMLPAYKVLYFGFMDEEDKALYKEPLEQLYAAHSVNEKAQRRIQSFHSDLNGKGNSIHCNCRLAG